MPKSCMDKCIELMEFIQIDIQKQFPERDPSIIKVNELEHYIKIRIGMDNQTVQKYIKHLKDLGFIKSAGEMMRLKLVYEEVQKYK